MARRLCVVRNIHGGVARAVMVILVSLAVGLCVVSGAPVAMEPSSPAPPSGGEDVGCFRPLSDVIWGFIVTLLACTVAMWGKFKFAASDTRRKMQLVLFAVFARTQGLQLHIDVSVQNVWLLWNYHKSIQNPLYHSRHSQFRKWRSLLSPFSKFAGRILFSHNVVVLYVLKGSSLLEEDWLWADEIDVENVSEAMVIGKVAEGKTIYGHYERKQLTDGGMIPLLMAEVMPEYDELKFLRGNSGFAVIAIAIQALGYM